MLAPTVPLAVALVELILRDGYHRFASEPTNLVVVSCLIGLSLVVAQLTEGRWSRWPASRVVRIGHWLSALAIWAWVVVLRGAAIGDWLVDASAVSLVAVCAGTAALTWLVSNESRWRRACPAVLLAITLFVVSQPVLGRLSSPALDWPPSSVANGAPAAATRPNDDVVVLLLDELNAREGPSLAKVLTAHGMTVAERAVDPVADATAKVIPQLWTRRAFRSPKPCSFTAICSDGHALDFATVTASRPDIDVVGFYHPYCAMRGLRWCERLAQPLPFADPGRWRCALVRRFGLEDGGSCAAVRDAPFLQLRQATLAAFWRAPFWRQGGMLFAHLPLPHPPGARPEGTLEVDYRDNLALASALLGEVADRARAAGRSRLRVIVFSDHPLRQSLWCDKPGYREQHCRPTAALENRQVPLIVATLGGSPPDLRPFDTNDRVFDLLALP